MSSTKQSFLPNGLSKCNPTDDCFVMCSDTNCFAEHKLVTVAERVQMCTKLTKQPIFGKVLWD